MTHQKMGPSLYHTYAPIYSCFVENNRTVHIGVDIGIERPKSGRSLINPVY